MEQIIKVIADTIDKSAIQDFRTYLKNLSNQRKWMICSDYCIDAEKKVNDVATFTVIPHYDHFDNIQIAISKEALTDIKTTSTIRENFIKYLRSDYLFHFSFIFGKRAERILKDATKDQFLSGLQQAIQILETWKKNTPSNKNSFQLSIDKLNSLSQEIAKKSFSFKLLKSIMLVSTIAAYIAYLLCRETTVNKIGWFSDRDKIIDAYQGIAFDLFYINHHCLCERDAIQDSNVDLIIGVPNKEQKMWYDELNKLPDYITGTLADYNMIENNVSKDKFAIMLQNCVADNSRIGIFNIWSNSGNLLCNRVIVDKIG